MYIWLSSSMTLRLSVLASLLFFIMRRRPSSSTHTDTLFPSTALVRSVRLRLPGHVVAADPGRRTRRTRVVHHDGEHDLAGLARHQPPARDRKSTRLKYSH